MRICFAWLLLLLAFATVSAQPAWSGGDACKKGGLWRRLASILNPASWGAKTEAIPPEVSEAILADYKGIEYVGSEVEKGPSGGYLISLERRDPLPKAIKPGYPRSRETSPAKVWSTVGSEVADFLGYGGYQAGDRIPDVAALNAAIARINGRYAVMGGKGKLLPFEYVEVDSRMPTREYLELVLSGKLPVARRGHYRLHDLLTHWSAGFLPDDAIAHVQSQVAAFFDFERWVRANHPELWRKARFDAMAYELSKAVDFGNFNYSLGIAAGQITDKRKFFEGLNEFTSDGKAPRATLEGLVKKTSRWKAPEEDPVKRAFKAYAEAREGDAAFTAGTYDLATAPLELESKMDRVRRQVRNLD